MVGARTCSGQVHGKLPERFAFFQAVEEALGNAGQPGLGSGERPGQDGARLVLPARHSRRAAQRIQSREGSGRPGSRLPGAGDRWRKACRIRGKPSTRALSGCPGPSRQWKHTTASAGRQVMRNVRREADPGRRDGAVADLSTSPREKAVRPSLPIASSCWTASCRACAPGPGGPAPPRKRPSSIARHRRSG